MATTLMKRRMLVDVKSYELAEHFLSDHKAVTKEETQDLAEAIQSAYGKPYSAAGFGMRMREWCDNAGLGHCSAHGVRKAAATIAAENGATAHQLMSIFGWTTLQQAEIYTKAAEQKRLAGSAMHMLLPTEQNETETGIVYVDIESTVRVTKEAGKS